MSFGYLITNILLDSWLTSIWASKILISTLRGVRLNLLWKSNQLSQCDFIRVANYKYSIRFFIRLLSIFEIQFREIWTSGPSEWESDQNSDENPA